MFSGEYDVIRIKCEGCGRVRLVRAIHGGEDDDLLQAEAGEYVERNCADCGKVTEHQVMVEAEAAA